MRCLRIASIAVLCVALLGISGCMNLEHRVGSGAQGSASVSQRQWYILWGLVPINRVDSKRLAEGATDYTIDTGMGPVDVVITFFTSMVTIYCQSVEVTR